MPNQHHAGNHNRSSQEDRASWSPTTDDQQRSERDREDDRWASDRNRSSHSEHDTGNAGRDRESTESYGQGQSGYSAGRSGEDHSQGYQNRNQAGSAGGHGYDDRPWGRSGMGLDDRFSGRGGGDWSERSEYRFDRPGGYGSDRVRETGYRSSRMGTGGMIGGANESQRFDQDRGGSIRYAGGYGGGMRDDRGMRGGGHRGKGPQSWQRSDERIRETVNEALADNDYIDATHIQVTVKDGEVTLSGTVEDRQMKRLAEDCVEQLSGVKEVQNQLRVQSSDGRTTGATANSRTGSSPSNPGDDKKARA